MKMRSKFMLVVLFSMGLNTLSASSVIKDISSDLSNDYLKQDTSINRQYLRIDPFNLPIIPPSSGIQFYRNGIIFLSSSKFEGGKVTEHVSFGTYDTYYAQLKDSLIDNQILFSQNASFQFPTDAIDFCNDFNTMYFTQLSEKDGSEKIYKATSVSSQGNNSVWNLNSSYESFCSEKAIYTHPAVSKDGSILIFSSDRKGSLGGLDLFVTRSVGGVWSSPENLGAIINSNKHELYPFLDSENNLYYSSNGLKGLGGYDIFVCRFSNGKWGKPQNLAKPVNTQFDDVAFKLNKNDRRSAFYTVMKGTKRRVEQLFQVRMAESSDMKLISNISQLFTGTEQEAEIIAAPVIVAAKATENVVKADEIPAIYAQKEVKPEELPKKEPVKVEKTVKVSETKSNVTPKAEPVINEASVKQPVVVPVETAVNKDEVIYRVQIISNVNAKGSYQIKINGKNYDTYEYLYKGAYRTCVGEFGSLSAATEFQGICRGSGQPQAFVVAFKNNERSTDPALFKKSASR